MTRYCETNACDFGVMLGDNIYDDGATLGKDGRDDNDRFRDMFTLPFSGLGQGVDDFQIYVTLGNHDWGTSRKGAMLQVEFHEKDPKFYMDGLFYSVKPPAAKGDVELFIVDTEILRNTRPNYYVSIDENGYETRSTTKKRRYREDAIPANDAEKNMLVWLEDAMKKSTAKWKFIVAHHPFWSSSGDKATDNWLMREIMREPACRYADGYFAGHDHTLELIMDNCEDILGKTDRAPLPHIISGAVAKTRAIDWKYMKAQDKQYPDRKTLWVAGIEFGFAHMTIDGDKASVRMITVPYEDGPRGMKQEFEHTFTRRSGQ